MTERESRPRGSIRSLLRAVHNDEAGGVSIETVLIIAAIALPILIFLYKVAWPRIQNYWNTQEETLFENADAPAP